MKNINIKNKKNYNKIFNIGKRLFHKCLIYNYNLNKILGCV